MKSKIFWLRASKKVWIIERETFWIHWIWNINYNSFPFLRKIKGFDLSARRVVARSNKQVPLRKANGVKRNFWRAVGVLPQGRNHSRLMATPFLPPCVLSLCFTLKAQAAAHNFGKGSAIASALVSHPLEISQSFLPSFSCRVFPLTSSFWSSLRLLYFLLFVTFRSDIFSSYFSPEFFY